MQKTPKANRPHIAVFGRRNVGKSSLINSLTNQNLALVSEVPGTTTDPVYKAMELQPLGPVVMIDTAGIDDQGELGDLRVKKTLKVIEKTDLALLVFEAEPGIKNHEKQLITRLKKEKIPIIGICNKIDNINKDLSFLLKDIKKQIDFELIPVSVKQKKGIEKTREKIVKKIPGQDEKDKIIGDLINKEDIVILVTPIDSGAPEGRLILPQVQTIRDIIDHEAISLVTKQKQLATAITSLEKKPALVVTDSQVFNEVDKIVPENILMTSFSLLFARYKGDLDIYLKGCKKLNNLKDGDKVLIAEACTHRKQHEDIGTVKIPAWLREKVKGDLIFENVSGREYPDNLREYDLVLHCGGCMINHREMLSRLYKAHKKGIPIVNYGMTIAFLHGILKRALKPFGELSGN